MKILLVDDSARDGTPAIAAAAAAGHHDVVRAVSVSEAQSVLSVVEVDLVILRVDGHAGRDAARIGRLRARQQPGIPMWTIAAKYDGDAQVAALDAGADLCLAPPFDDALIAAYLRLLVRNRRTETRLGQFAWNWGTRQGFIASHPLALSRYETLLLESLLRVPDRTVPLEILARRLEGELGRFSANRLYTHVCLLRKKLAGTHLKIKNAYGLGYALQTANP